MYVPGCVCPCTRHGLFFVRVSTQGRRPGGTRIFGSDDGYFRTGPMPNFTTLPQRLKQLGYATHALGKVFHGEHSAHEVGISFDSYATTGYHDRGRLLNWPSFARPGTGGALPAFRDDARCPWKTKGAIKWMHKKLAASTPTNRLHAGCSWGVVPPGFEADHQWTLPDTHNTNRAIEMLRGWSQPGAGFDKNFFLAIGYYKPHLPFIAPKRFFDLYPHDWYEILDPDHWRAPPTDSPVFAVPASNELQSYLDIAVHHARVNGSRHGQLNLPMHTIKALNRAYFATVSYVDHEFGRVHDQLQASPFVNNTIVVLLSDHGVHLGEHGMFSKHTNFNLDTSVPLMIHVPGIPAAVSRQYAELVDVFPTVLGAAAQDTVPRCGPDSAASAPFCRQGEDLTPSIGNAAVSLKMVAFSQYERFGAYVLKQSGWDGHGTSDATPEWSTQSLCLRAVCVVGYTMLTQVDGVEYRYTEWPYFNTPGHPQKPDFTGLAGRELYNHADDPSEHTNVAASAALELGTYLSGVLRRCAVHGCRGGTGLACASSWRANFNTPTADARGRYTQAAAQAPDGRVIWKATTQKQCALRCLQNRQCASFSYNSRTSGCLTSFDVATVDTTSDTAALVSSTHVKWSHFVRLAGARGCNLAPDGAAEAASNGAPPATTAPLVPVFTTTAGGDPVASTRGVPNCSAAAEQGNTYCALLRSFPHPSVHYCSHSTYGRVFQRECPTSCGLCHRNPAAATSTRPAMLEDPVTATAATTATIATAQVVTRAMSTTYTTPALACAAMEDAAVASYFDAARTGFMQSPAFWALKSPGTFTILDCARACVRAAACAAFQWHENDQTCGLKKVRSAAGNMLTHRPWHMKYAVHNTVAGFDRRNVLCDPSPVANSSVGSGIAKHQSGTLALSSAASATTRTSAVKPTTTTTATTTHATLITMLTTTTTTSMATTTTTTTTVTATVITATTTVLATMTMATAAAATCPRYPECFFTPPVAAFSVDAPPLASWSLDDGMRTPLTALDLCRGACLVFELCGLFQFGTKLLQCVLRRAAPHPRIQASRTPGQHTFQAYHRLSQYANCTAPTPTSRAADGTGVTAVPVAAADDLADICSRTIDGFEDGVVGFVAGFYLPLPGPAETLGTCRAYCAREQQCRAFHWRQPGGSTPLGQCGLKSAKASATTLQVSGNFYKAFQAYNKRDHQALLTLPAFMPATKAVPGPPAGWGAGSECAADTNCLVCGGDGMCTPVNHTL